MPIVALWMRANWWAATSLAAIPGPGESLPMAKAPGLDFPALAGVASLPMSTTHCYVAPRDGHFSLPHSGLMCDELPEQNLSRTRRLLVSQTVFSRNLADFLLCQVMRGQRCRRAAGSIGTSRTWTSKWR